jgi:riboflavin synthase
LARYVVEKGYIAVDGISLTVVEATPAAFTVSLVRHTQEHSTIAGKGCGEPVNLEVDLLAKYAERFGGAFGGAAGRREGVAVVDRRS